MLGLPSKANQTDAAKVQPQRTADRRHPARYTLVPTPVGSMMLMMPRRESDRGPIWLDTIPPMK